MTTRNLLLLFTLLTLLAGCAGVPKEVPEGLQPEEYFKYAQSSVVDWGNYKRALHYYEEFIKDFPDMKSKIIEAEYEIAFIYYKQENYYESEKRFKAILEKHKSGDSAFYPEWTRLLSEKILAKIEEEKKY